MEANVYKTQLIIFEFVLLCTPERKRARMVMDGAGGRKRVNEDEVMILVQV